MEAEVNSVKAATDVDEPSPPPAESQPESGTAAPLFTLPFALYLKPLPTIIYQSVPKNIHQDGSTSDSDSSSDSSSSNHSTSESDEPQSPTARRKHSKSISLGPNAKLIPTKLRSDPHDLNTLEAVLSVANPQAASQPVAKLLSLLSNADSSPGFDRLREFFDTRFDLPSPSTSSIPVDTKSQQRKTSLPTTLSKLRKASNSNSRNPSFSQRKHEEHLKDDIEALESASAFNPSLYTTSQTSEGEDLPGPLFQHSTSPKRHPTSTSRSKSSITRSLSSNNNKKRSSKAPRIVLPARKSSTGGGAGISSGGGAQKTIPPKVIRFPVRLDLHSVRLASKPKLQKSRSIVSRGSSFGGGGGRFRNKRNGRGLGRKQASAEGALQFRTPSTSSLRKGAVSRSRRVASDTESHLSGINGSGFNSEAAGFQSGHALEPVASPESGYHGSLNDNGDGNNHSGWTLSTSPEKAAINGNESSSNAYNGISTSSVNGTNSRGNSSATPSSWRGGNASSVTSASISGGGDRKDSFVSGTGSAVASSGQEGNRRPSMVQRFLDFGGLRKKGRSRSGTGGSEMSRKSASSASADEINIQQQSSIPPVPNLPSVIASSQAQDFPSTLKIVGLDQHEGILASPIDLVSPRTEIKMPSFQPQSKDLNLSKTISTSSGSDDANHAVEDEDDADDVEAHWSRRRAAKVSKSGSRTESFGDSGRRLFKSSSTSAFAASEHDLGPVREGHAWAASSGTQDLNEEEDSFDEEEDERSLWDEDGSEAFPMEEGEDFLSLLREAAKLSLSPEILQSAVEQQDNIASGLESRGSQSQTPRGGSSPRNSLHHLSEKAKGKLPESSSGSRSPLTPNGKLSELPSLLTSSSSSSLRQVTPPGSFEMERQAEMNADVEAIAEANSRAEERFKDLEKAHWWPSGSSDPFPVVISLALGLHFGWEGIMNLCYGHGSNSCPEAPKGQDSSLAGGDFAPLGRAADMEERGRRGAGRVSDWWAGVQNAQELEANTSAVDEDEDKKNQDASVPDTSTRNDANDSQSSPSEVVVDDDEFDPDQAGRERTNSTRFGKWLGIKGRGGSMSSSKGPGSGSFRRSSTSAGSESQDGNGSNQPPSPSASQLGEIRARERLNSQQKNLQKEKEDRNRTWKDWYNLCKSIKGWVEAYELARIRAGLSREIGVEPPPSALLQSQSNEQKLDSALSDEDDETRALPSLKNSLKSSTQNPGTDSGFHEKEKSQAQAQVQQNNNNVPTDSSLLGAPSSNISVQRTRRPSATSSKSGFSETSSLAPPRSEISEISNTSSNPRSVFSTSPIPTCVLKDITERENGFRRSAGIPEGLGIGEDGEEHADYRWAKSRLRRKEIGTSTILFASSLSYHLSQLSTSEWVHRSAWELDYLEMCVFRSSLVAERFPPPGTQIVPSTSAYHFQNQEGTSKENDRTNLCPMPNVDGSWNSLKWKNWLGTVKEGQIIVPAVSWQTWWTLISVLNGADGSGRSYNLQVKTPEEPFEELTDMNAVYI